MAAKLPKVGDCFYNQELEIMGRIDKIYVHPMEGIDVLDVEFPGTDFEIETYSLEKIDYHEGNANFDTSFTCNDLNYIGE